MDCLHEIFEAQADGWPDDIAVVHRGNNLTYEEIEHRANRLAHYLRSLGAERGELVGLHLERSEHAIVAILAVLKSGAAYVPLDSSCPDDRIQHILEEAEVSLLVTESALAEHVEQLGVALVIIDALEHAGAIAGQSEDRIPRDETGVSSDDLCHVIYTSGTAGPPKGVMTEHRNAFSFTASFNEVCRLEPNDRIYQGSPLSIDRSVEEIWVAFSNGATLVIGPPELARLGDETGRHMVDNGVTYLSTVPTFLSTIHEDVPCLRVVVVSGEPCPPELVRRWVRPGRRMFNVYGRTETTVNATAWVCVPGAPVTIGHPLRGYELHILDERQQPVREGDAGELYVGGVGVSRGYLGQSELTRGAFVRDPSSEGKDAVRLHRTGDLVRRSGNGGFILLGRIDGQVKVRGRRIELVEVESVLREHRDIEAAAVTVVEHEGLRDLSAHVVPARADNGSLDRDGVLELLRRRLPLYMVPAYLDTIDALPILASGKVDRKRLPAPRTPLVLEKRDIVAPRTELERRIAGVWESVFATSPISVEGDLFLDLGGDSLLVAQLVALLDRDEGIEVSLREVCDHPTVAALAVVVAARAEKTEGEREREGTEPRPTSRDVFEGLGRARRFACVSLQALSVVVLYGLAALPFLAFTYVFFLVTRGGLAISTGVFSMIGLVLISFPVWVALTIALKWLVIGRHRPGAWPVWGLQYFRFWLVSRLQAMSGIGLVSGTPLMNLYYRLMGAKVGYGCIIDTPLCVAYDLVTIGSDTCIGSETQLLGYRIEDGMLRVGRVDIGRRCFVGTHSALGLDTRMGDDSRLGDLSLLPDGTEVPPGESVRGSPAERGDVPVPEVVIGASGQGHRRPSRVLGAALERRHPVLFGLLHVLLIGALELFLVVTLVPGLVIVAAAFAWGGPLWGMASLLAAVPIGTVSFCLLAARFKAHILRRMEPGIYAAESSLFLRKWLVDALMKLSGTYMHAIYKTIYLPPWLRLMGARIGPRAEISTVSQITPDLIDIDDESFLAEGSIIGGRRFFRGRVQVGRNRIGRRSFVGNNAMLPVGTSLGTDCCLGVSSTLPVSRDTTPDGTEWLGSPSFRLPCNRKVGGSDESMTYAPTLTSRARRLAIDAVRVLVPGFILVVGAVIFVSTVIAGLSVLPSWGVWLLVPVTAVFVAAASAISVVALKNVVMGRFEPVVKPLWSTYVRWNEVINGAYETAVVPALAPLLGTPFFNAYLRLLGCKIGQNVYIGTTRFSGFDLVEIGDYAALNTGVVVQSHLFEDRIMKSSYVRIGDECSIGNMSVVLCDTEMGRGSSIGPLSLLMKGEAVPERGRRIGIPAGHEAGARSLRAEAPGSDGVTKVA